MSVNLRTLATSLELRLLAPLGAIIAAVLLVHALVGRLTAREEVSRFIAADLDRSVSLVQGAMHDGMLLNRKAELQTRIERLGSSPGFTGIRVYDKSGRIALSAHGDERGRVEGIGAESCVVCHAGGALSGDAVLRSATVVRNRNGHDTARAFVVIRNEPSCAATACHPSPSARPVLGVLDVEMTTAPFDAAIAGMSRQIGWTTALLIVGSGMTVALVVRRVVHEPLARLREGAGRIASGDLSTRIEVRGDRELASLAGAFNAMVVDLGTARDELDRWSRMLEQRVEEKTRALRAAQQQMSQVETMASLGKLSATVAHEINNPLSGILAYARLVRRELTHQPLDPAVREEVDGCLSLVDKECVRCADIVKNLLTFARRRGARPGPTDLNEIVDHSLMLVRHHMELHRVRAETTLLEGDAEIVAVAGQIQQALLALLMNAIEAMQDNGDRPAVVEVCLASAGPDVEVTVSDTGSGIPEDLVPHIFEPFVTTKEASGVGLGLSVVYGVIHGHGGTIDVRSSRGCGTTFTIRLPRRCPEEIGEVSVPETAPKEMVR